MVLSKFVEILDHRLFLKSLMLRIKKKEKVIVKKLTEKISQISLENVLTGSTSLSLNTFIRLVPSVSNNQSAIALNSPVSVTIIRFFESVCGKCIYTLLMASIPCNKINKLNFWLIKSML